MGAPVPQRQLCQVTDYAGLQAALRARAHELKVAVGGEPIAEVSGLPLGYVSKLLSVRPQRRIGWDSLLPLLGVLGARLLLVEDQQAMRRYVSKIPKRTEHAVRTGKRRHNTRKG